MHTNESGPAVQAQASRRAVGVASVRHARFPAATGLAVMNSATIDWGANPLTLLMARRSMGCVPSVIRIGPNLWTEASSDDGYENPHVGCGRERTRSDCVTGRGSWLRGQRWHDLDRLPQGRSCVHRRCCNPHYQTRRKLLGRERCKQKKLIPTLACSRAKV